MIGADGSQLGIMETKRAIELAESQNLDLAEVAPTSQPPVCKILDYGKYKYQMKKKQKAAKKKQVVTTLKEVQFRPQTDTHDVDFKVKHIVRFLEEGNKVKVSVRFRGREATHVDIGHALIKQIIDMVGNSGIVEQIPKMEGKILSLIFAPNAKAKKVEKVGKDGHSAPAKTESDLKAVPEKVKEGVKTPLSGAQSGTRAEGQ